MARYGRGAKANDPHGTAIDERQFLEFLGVLSAYFENLGSLVHRHAPPKAFRREEARPTTTEEQNHEHDNPGSNPGDDRER